MKKKLFTCIGLFGLALASVFASPIVSHAAATTENTPEIVQNENLFNKDLPSLVYNTGYGVNPTDGYGELWVKVSWIPIKPNTTYSFSKTYSRYCLYNGSDWKDLANDVYTITTLSDSQYLQIRQYMGTAQSVETSKTYFSDMTMVEGSTIPESTPPAGETTNTDCPYKMVNEKGVETTVINSGNIYETHDGKGNFNPNTLDPNSSEFILNKTNGNVFIMCGISDYEQYDMFDLSPYGFTYDADFMNSLSYIHQDWDYCVSDNGGPLNLYYFKRGSKLSGFLNYITQASESGPEFCTFFTDYVVTEKETTTPDSGGTPNVPFYLKDASGAKIDTITNSNIVNITANEGVPNGYETFADMVEDCQGQIEYISTCMTNSDIEGKVILFNEMFFQSTGNLDSLVGPINCNINVEPFGSRWGKDIFNTQHNFYAYGVLNATDFIAALEKAATDFDNGNTDVNFVLTNCTFQEIDTTAPEIGGTIHVPVDVDNQPTIDEIISHVYAKDETDGYVPVKVESSTYVQGMMEVGDYVINVSASDSNSNKNTAIIEVHRYDNAGPIISGTASYDLNYDHDLTLEKIESFLTITDNVDSGLVLEKVSDTFSGNEHKLGNYQIVYRSKDKSNIYGPNYTINLSVKNKGFAVISGSSTIRVGTNETLTLDLFKSTISVVDGYDGTITNYQIDGFDEYTKTSKVVGTNIVRVSYTNSGGNTAYFDRTIIKEDRISPEILFDGYFILLKQGEVFGLDMVLSLAAQVLSLNVEDIVDIKGEYDTNTVGSYNLDVCLANGEVKPFKLSVVSDYDKVPNKENDKDFFTTDGYVENLLKPSKWTGYHYLTLLATAVVLVVIIVFIARSTKKKK